MSGLANQKSGFIKQSNTIDDHFSDQNSSINKIIALGEVKWPLSFKIPLAGFIFSLVISLIVAFAFYLESYQVVSKEKMNELSLKAEVVKPLLTGFYRQGARDVTFLSVTPPIADIINASQSNNNNLLLIGQQRLNSIFIELLKTKPNYKKMSFITTSLTNDVVVSAYRENNKVKGLSGDELQKNIELNALKNIHMIKSRQVFFSKISFTPQLNAISEQPSAAIFVAIPVFTPHDNSLFGLVAIELDLTAYINELKEETLKEINFHITDSQGHLLTHSNLEGDFHDNSSLQKAFPELTQIMSNNEISAEIFNVNNLAYYSIVNFNKLSNVSPLHLVIESHNDEFILAIKAMRFRAILICLSLAFISLLLSIFMARKITKPLSVMSENLSKYKGQGRIDSLPMDEKNEIGLLARSFHNLLMTI